MNVVFWMGIAMVCLIAWYLLSNLFSKIGEVGTKIASKVKTNIDKDGIDKENNNNL